MYFWSKSDAEVSLPTQPPFSWLILDFLHQTRGNTWKRSKIRLYLHQRGSGNPTERQQCDKYRWCREILLEHSGLVVMMLRSRKLCLNQESSSNEGFVGSNTVVQTSVIVWYLLCMYIYIYIYIQERWGRTRMPKTRVAQLYGIMNE